MNTASVIRSIRETAVELVSIVVIIAAPLLALSIYVASLVGDLRSPQSHQVSRAAE